MNIDFTAQIFKEGRMYVAYARELDVSSCGYSKQKALENLKQAVGLFLEEAEKKGSLGAILEESGYTKKRANFTAPKFISVHKTSLVMPKVYA
jgi:predicted RNase H-like HicB family nuclease